MPSSPAPDRPAAAPVADDGLPVLTPALASRFAALALGHVTREYPNKLDHVLAGPEDVRGPRALHPVFYGSFDWHSCVHGYWLLARLLRRVPSLPEAGAVRALFDAHFTPAHVAGEVAYLARPESRGFERPYGWAWLLALAAELGRDETADGRRWADALRPLADAFAARFRAFLPQADYPVRVGTHFNTAFALRLALDYADEAGDGALGALVRDRARAWYGGDRDCQAWEPGGDDFLSSALVEAECMRRALPAGEFASWFERFLPRLARGEPATLFAPAAVSDRTDGKIAHLDGLNLSRAWCWRALAGAPGGPLGAPASWHAAALAAAGRHLAAGLPHVAGDYMGEHWLATFAVLALDGGPGA
ncbi:hypothetical protein tb265_15060 [Gemmatimonadetes bacterium T265]|nr:hypothetical protein tb265_15060 [Gemmatimonadetes bacterium T265]